MRRNFDWNKVDRWVGGAKIASGRIDDQIWRRGCWGALGKCNRLTPGSLFRRLFRRQLVSTDTCDDSVLSYGVRNSIAAYLAFSESPAATHTRAESRKKKSRSVYALPDNDYDA